MPPSSPDAALAKALDERQRFIERLIREAGALALRSFRDPTLAIENKGVQDFVTAADRAVESLLVERIAAAFPGDAFIGEEGGERGEIASDTPVWVIDPIDGTANYARGIPLWCVSIGVVVNGDVELGILYHPCADELYVARRGRGATRNGQAIHASQATQPESTRVNVGFNRRRPMDMHMTTVRRLLENSCEYSRLGSGALGMAFVADGRLEGFWESHINSWDVAAGICLVREAGGWVSDFFANDGLHRGNPILATGPGIRDYLCGLLGDITEPKLG